MTAKVLKSEDVIVVGDPDAVAGQKAAIREAFEEGVAEGRRLALADLDTEIARLRETLADAGDRARGDLAASVRLDADVIARLASDLAAWFTDGAVAADPNVLLVSLQAALSDLGDAVGLVLHVHPDVAEALGDDHPAVISAVRADPTLGRADHRLVAAGSAIERRWTDAMAALTDDLAAALRIQSSNGHPPSPPAADHPT